MAVLVVEGGPANAAVVAFIAGSAVVAVAGGIAFWRRSRALGGRPRAAALLLVVGFGWAALGAYVIGWLIVAFNPR